MHFIIILEASAKLMIPKPNFRADQTLNKTIFHFVHRSSYRTWTSNLSQQHTFGSSVCWKRYISVIEKYKINFIRSNRRATSRFDNRD